jgi:hypothetical protein
MAPALAVLWHCSGTAAVAAALELLLLLLVVGWWLMRSDPQRVAVHLQ